MVCAASILSSNSEKEYKKQNWGINIVKIVKIVDKEVENLTQREVNSR